MKRLLLTLPMALFLTGCFTASQPREAREWTVEFDRASLSGRRQPRFGVCRVLQTAVRAPYDSKPIAVLRADGSMAFDPYNRFSAAPAALLGAAALDALNACGDFEAVLDSVSSVRSDVDLEMTATRLVLDCTEAGARRAKVELTLSMLERRKFVKTVNASGEAFVDDGNYTKAFSAAFSAAVSDCIRRL